MLQQLMITKIFYRKPLDTADNGGRLKAHNRRERMSIDNEHLCFLGHKYEVRVLNEGTDREQLVIYKRIKNTEDKISSWDRSWEKPLVIGG
jgi:hypothetical protein